MPSLSFTISIDTPLHATRHHQRYFVVGYFQLGMALERFRFNGREVTATGAESQVVGSTGIITILCNMNNATRQGDSVIM